jgi:hypothetical protein
MLTKTATIYQSLKLFSISELFEQYLSMECIMSISQRISFFSWFLIATVFAQFIGCSDDKTTTGPSPIAATTSPNITSVNSTLFTVGKLKSFTFTASGNPAPTIKLSGILPTGLTYNDTTGILSGTASGGTSGTYPLAVTASNGISPNAVDNVTLTVSRTVLIVHDGTAGIEGAVVTNLSSKITAAGLTPSTSVGVPAGTLNSYAQIWDVRFNNTTPLTSGDITNYTLYLVSGGSLFVIGENTYYFIVRDSSIAAMIGTLGGGTVTFMTAKNLQKVQSPFTGPNTIHTVTFPDAAGTLNPGTGAFVTKDSTNIGAAIVYWPGTLPNAPAGRLLAVFDINFLESSADASLQIFVDNLIALP